MNTIDKTICPLCGAKPCYISFSGIVECSNFECSNYSISLYPPELSIPTTNNDEHQASTLTQQELDALLAEIEGALDKLDINGDPLLKQLI